MSFQVEKNDQYAVVSYTGRSNKLDSLLSPDLKSEFVMANTEGHKYLILDLSPFTYCDSSGLSAVLVGNRLSKNSGGSLVICGIQPMVQKLIAISQLDNILSLVPTLDEARQYITMEIVERGVDN